jgi:hypothetical protein
MSWKGSRLAIDVQQFGDALDRHVVVGAGLGRSSTPRTRGTLGSFAVDNAGATVAITAMHVSDEDEMQLGDPPVPVTTPSQLDDPSAQHLGHVVAGTRTDVDAARIQLAAGTVANGVAPIIGRISGWRPLHYPGDHEALVRMYGAKSGYREGKIENPSIDLPAFNLRQTIVVSIDSAPGDSGAAIVDSENLVLGFLVGRGNAMPPHLRLFTPASLVLAKLGCDIPMGGI